MNKKILIADDEPNILLSLEFLMKREGYTVVLARDGGEALRAPSPPTSTASSPAKAKPASSSPALRRRTNSSQLSSTPPNAVSLSIGRALPRFTWTTTSA